MAKTKKQAAEIVNILKEKYPSAECSLEYEGEAWKLLIMGRLSAQCTDQRVNVVCETLFDELPSLQDVANAPIEKIEQIIKPCGLYHSKAKNIKEACQMLIDKHNGVLPNTMDELLALPGVGRKIANLLLGDVYHQPAIVTDTHCIRICGKLGFYSENEKTPFKIEKILVSAIEPDEQSDFCHRLVLFGREICSARAPLCEKCPLTEHCDNYNKKTETEKRK